MSAEHDLLNSLLKINKEFIEQIEPFYQSWLDKSGGACKEAEGNSIHPVFLMAAFDQSTHDFQVQFVKMQSRLAAKELVSRFGDQMSSLVKAMVK